MVIWGWKNLFDHKALKCDPLPELVRIYKETNERASNDPNGAGSVPPGTGKLQAGDKENFRYLETNAWRFRCRISKA